MKLIKILFISIIIFSAEIFSAEMFADDFSASIDSSQILIGSRATLTLRASSSEKVVFPILPDTINGLIVISKSQIDTANSNGVKTLTQKVYLTAFDSGNYQISPLIFLTIDRNNNTKIFNSKALFLTVNTLDISKMKDINDIKKHIEIERSFWDYWVYYVIGIAVLLALFLYFKFFRRKKKVETQAQVAREIILDPKKWLNDELSALKQQELWRSGEFKKHYTVISDAFRRYFELKYKLPTMEQTTPEIEASLRDNLDANLLSEIIALLEQADLVKFAKYQANDSEAIQILNTAFALSDRV